MRLYIKRFLLLVQSFEHLFEVKVLNYSLGHTDIASGIQAPTLRCDFVYRGDFAQSCYVGVCALWEVLLHQDSAVLVGLYRFVAIEPYDVCQKLDLLGGELAVCTIDLSTGVPCSIERR